MRFLSAICFFLIEFSAFGQDYSLRILQVDSPIITFEKKMSYKNLHKDSLSVVKEYKAFLKALQNKGFVFASFDSIYFEKGSCHVFLFLGQKAGTIHLQNGNIESTYVSDFGKKVFDEKNKYDFADVEKWKAKLVQNMENRGFPFAEVWLDSFQFNEQKISAKVYADKHDMILYDTLKTTGTSKAKKIFLRNYLGIKFLKPYNESNVKRISSRLNELQFLENVKSPTVSFSQNKALVNLYINKKKASQFDLLIGLLPGSSGQKVLITGQAKLHLFSPFGVGEEFFLQWEKLQPKTQKLDVKIVYPYVVGLPLGLNVYFGLYKMDTTYLDLDRDFGIQYQLLGSNYLKASLKQKTTIVTNVDVSYIKLNRTLPRILDINTNEFALEFFYQKLNYRFNPLYGFVIKTSASAGVKKLKRNNAIIDLYDEVSQRSFSYLYDTIKSTYFQFHLDLSAEKYWKIHKRMTIKTNAEAHYFYSPRVLTNEKYRLGGIQSLRGFDDQSIFTPYYFLANVEYRYLLSKNAYFYTFFNTAMVEWSSSHYKNRKFDFPFGFGVGTTLETKIGLFGISYAMGTQQENKLSFRSAKIHFGYINYF